ncbi:hypothetical protein L7F22_007580 [Adiantum nelumboides]|nr:hypothetical protein [Adiantum nelumboides]
MVKFTAPLNCGHYQGHSWFVKVGLLDDYPRRAPSVTFTGNIIHMNIDDLTGLVDAEAVNGMWSPSDDLITIFTVIIPHLLVNPNVEAGNNALMETLWKAVHEDENKNNERNCKGYIGYSLEEARKVLEECFDHLDRKSTDLLISDLSAGSEGCF